MLLFICAFRFFCSFSVFFAKVSKILNFSNEVFLNFFWCEHIRKTKDEPKVFFFLFFKVSKRLNFSNEVFFGVNKSEKLRMNLSGS